MGAASDNRRIDRVIVVEVDLLKGIDPVGDFVGIAPESGDVKERLSLVHRGDLDAADHDPARLGSAQSITARCPAATACP